MTFLLNPFRFATALSVTDTFSEADGTNLHGKSITTGAKTWTVHNGTLDVNTGKARVTAGSGSSWATIAAGVSDFDMSVVITTGAAAIDGIIFRVVDTSNYIRLDINNTGDELDLIRNVAGTESGITFASIPGLAVGNVATYRALCVGSSIKIYRDAVLKIDTTDSSHQTATKHGIIGFNTNTRFDDFSLVTA